MPPQRDSHLACLWASSKRCCSNLILIRMIEGKGAGLLKGRGAKDPILDPATPLLHLGRAQALQASSECRADICFLLGEKLLHRNGILKNHEGATI
jgi:hypothetical protein